MKDATLVIFDCDGVLIDSEAIYLQVELAFLEAKGIDVSREWYVSQFMALAADKWKAKLSALLVEKTGSPLTEPEYEALKAESRGRVMSELRAIDGIHDLLDALRLPVCVASSTAMKFLPNKLERAGLSSHFGTHVYSGEMVENGKPAPDLFLHAARASGGHAPGNCIVIEDSVNGVRGAKAAGMFAVGFLGGSHVGADHGESLKSAGADIVVENHAALGRWFAELEAN